MATPFVRDVKLSRAIDRAFGEDFTFIATAADDSDVDLPHSRDASRPDFKAKGVFENPGKRVYPKARGAVQDDNANERSATMPSASIADDALLWRPRRGDFVRREFNGSIYEISRAPPDGMGRTTFFLTRQR